MDSRPDRGHGTGCEEVRPSAGDDDTMSRHMTWIIKGSRIYESTINPIFLCASAALVRQAKPGFSIDLKRDQHVK